jgi:hypothetical protein
MNAARATWQRTVIPAATLAVKTRSAAALLECEPARTHDLGRGVLCMSAGGASGRDCRKPGLPRVELNLAAAAGLASRRRAKGHQIVQIELNGACRVYDSPLNRIH